MINTIAKLQFILGVQNYLMQNQLIIKRLPKLKNANAY